MFGEMECAVFFPLASRLTIVDKNARHEQPLLLVKRDAARRIDATAQENESVHIGPVRPNKRPYQNSGTVCQKIRPCSVYVNWAELEMRLAEASLPLTCFIG